MGKWTAIAQIIIDKMDMACSVLTDPQASQVVEIYPPFPKDGSRVTAGTRINWNGQLKRAAVDVWGTEQNDPEHAPTLWENINYRDGYRVIPEQLTVGTAFARGECGWWGDMLYESLLDANVWTPDAYPSGWKECSA